MREGAALETAEPERAFLTIDSGFPLAELEADPSGRQAFCLSLSRLRKCRCCFPRPIGPRPTRRQARGGNDFLNALLDDPVLARLYWAMARMDSETGEAFRNSRESKPASVRSGPRFLWQSHSDSEWTG